MYIFRIEGIFLIQAFLVKTKAPSNRLVSGRKILFVWLITKPALKASSIPTIAVGVRIRIQVFTYRFHMDKGSRKKVLVLAAGPAPSYGLVAIVFFSFFFFFFYNANKRL